MSFVGKKLVKVINSLPASFAFTYALHSNMIFEIPAKASRTWEIIQRLFVSYESEKGILRGQEEDSHGLNKWDSQSEAINKKLITENL
jgi:hypothetical protein